MKEKLHNNITGHVLVKDSNTGEILVDAMNAIHLENTSTVLALGFADRSNGHIHEMVFGNGGSIVSGTGAITYFPPNVTGSTAQLYNQTYRKVVDDQSPLNLNTSENFLTVNHTLNTTYTDIVVTCNLDYNEPSGQGAFDDTTTTESDFIFDEIGLKAYDPTPSNGLLLSHIIFSPVQKSLNRQITVIYTIRISLS